MTREEATQVLLMLKAAYPRGDDGLDERLIVARQDLMLSVLMLWNLETAKAAVREVVLTKTFYPSVAELRSAYETADVPRPRKYLALPAAGAATPDEVKAAFARIRDILGVDVGAGIKRETA